MPTWEKNRIKSFCIDLGQSGRVCERALCGIVMLETLSRLGMRIGNVALRIERRLTTGRRCQCDFRSRIAKHVVRRCKFLKPKSGFLAGVTQLSM